MVVVHSHHCSCYIVVGGTGREVARPCQAGAIDRRARVKYRSLLVSSSWSVEKRRVVPEEPKRRRGLGGLCSHSVSTAVRLAPGGRRAFGCVQEMAPSTRSSRTIVAALRAECSCCMFCKTVFPMTRRNNVQTVEVLTSLHQTRRHSLVMPRLDRRASR